MTTKYFAAVKRADGLTDIFTNDAMAYEIVVGWGSGSHGQVAADFYGERALDYTAPGLVPQTKGRMRPGDPAWVWHFGPDHADTMLRLIEKHRDDPKYYTKAEQRRANHLAEICADILQNQVVRDCGSAKKGDA
jgi:hypothetical protein